MPWNNAQAWRHWLNRKWSPPAAARRRCGLPTSNTSLPVTASSRRWLASARSVRPLLVRNNRIVSIHDFHFAIMKSHDSLLFPAEISRSGDCCKLSGAGAGTAAFRKTAIGAVGELVSFASRFGRWAAPIWAGCVMAGILGAAVAARAQVVQGAVGQAAITPITQQIEL